MNTYAQYAYNSELVQERQARFVSYATPDLSDLVIEDGFDPKMIMPIAVIEDVVYPQEAQHASRPMWVSLIAAIINLVR